jgi:hypothetical protein
MKAVKTFTSSGVTLSSNGNIYDAQKSLYYQALKTMFSLNTLFDYISFNSSEKIRLYYDFTNFDLWIRVVGHFKLIGYC